MRLAHSHNRVSLLWTAVVVLVLVLVLACSGAQNQVYPDHVVLISIDGFRPELYLDTTWPAPMIQQMAREGAYATAVRGVFPSETYPSHTTIVTGAFPSRHGIYYNTPFEPKGQSGRYHWYESAIRVPTLWDAVRKAGMKSASIGWPVSVDAPIDWNIPEVWSVEQDVDLMTAIRSASRPADLFLEIEQEATGTLTASDFADRLIREDRTGVIAGHLLERYRPALLTVHLIAVDHYQHQSGRQGPSVQRAVAAADRAVSHIVQAADRAGIDGRTAFIVMGDHGFVDVHTEVAPNVWLVEGGLMEARRDRGDWRATFHRNGGSVFLHLADPEDREAVSEVRALLAGLPGDVQSLFRIIEPEERDRIGSDPTVPLSLSAVPGVAFIPSPRGPAIRAATGGTHGHYPDFHQIHTGFVGWGTGFRSQAVVPSMGLEDIAPLIAELLGLPFEAPDGVIPAGLLEVQN